MAHGVGKYDAEATKVREVLNASAVMLAVVDGDKGSGFSCQVAHSTVEEARERTVMLAEALESIAKQMRVDAAKLGS